MTESQVNETRLILAAVERGCPNPMLIGYGGSIAYGTSTDTSDVDIRGIYVNPIEEFIGLYPDSEQFMLQEYDVTIYSLKKMMKLLADCNPNTIELLGLKPDQYLFISGAGKHLLDHSDLFLSKKAGYTFGCYARSQLNRLMNKSGRAVSAVVSNEARSLTNALASLKQKEGIEGVTVNTDDKNGVVLTINGSFSIDKATRLFGEINNIHSDYKKSHRNDKAVAHNKIGKHMMHLVRLYLMGIDILKDHKIVTYRPEHDLLMDIRNGRYFESDGVTPNAAFNRLVSDLSKQFDDAWKSSTLPEHPDNDKLNALMMNCVCESLGIEINELDLF